MVIAPGAVGFSTPARASINRQGILAVPSAIDFQHAVGSIDCGDALCWALTFADTQGAACFPFCSIDASALAKASRLAILLGYAICLDGSCLVVAMPALLAEVQESFPAFAVCMVSLGSEIGWAIRDALLQKYAAVGKPQE